MSVSKCIAEISAYFKEGKDLTSSGDMKKHVAKICDLVIDPQESALSMQTLKLVITTQPKEIVIFVLSNMLYEHASVVSRTAATTLSNACLDLLSETYFKSKSASEIFLGTTNQLTNMLCAVTVTRTIDFFYSPDFQRYAQLLPDLREMILSMYTISDYFCTGQFLGKGQWGHVYKAIHRLSGTVVALKKMCFSDKPEATRSVLLREAQVMRHVNHPSVVRLFDAILDDKQQYLYLVMEYCPYKDLERYFVEDKNCALTDGEIQHLMRELAQGLQFLRTKAIVHRDLKLTNLLVFLNNSEPKLKLCDFTYAKVLKTEDLTRTICGSPLYMAPEVLQGNPYSEKADLWSVGVIMFQLYFNDYPFNASTYFELIKNISGNALRFPPTRQLSKEATALLSGLLEKDPSIRISWAEFFIHPYLAAPIPPGTDKRDEKNSKDLEIEKLRELVSSLENQISTFQNEKNDRERVLVQKEETIVRLERELDTSTRATSELQTTINNLEDRISLSNEEAGHTRQELDRTTQLVEKLTEENKKLQQEVLSLSDRIGDLESINLVYSETLKDREEHLTSVVYELNKLKKT